jgi:hypothetical protein
MSTTQRDVLGIGERLPALTLQAVDGRFVDLRQRGTARLWCFRTPGARAVWPTFSGSTNESTT